MATLSPVILPAKALKGGRHKVRISVAHNGESRYIVTDIIIDSAKEFKNGQVVKRADASFLNTKLRGLLQKYQQAIDALEYSAGLTCPELVFAIKNAGGSGHRTLLSIYEEYVNYSRSRVKPGTLQSYSISMNAIRRCYGDMILMEHITHTSILALDEYMRKNKYSPAYMSSVLGILKTLVKFATRCGYVKYNSDPFLGYTVPKPEVRQSWLTVEQIKAIRDYKPQCETRALVRDLFMLSYYLGGINIEDLKDIVFDSDRLRYERRKTERCSKLNKYVEFAIPAEAMEIIERRKRADGRLALTESMRARNCGNTFRYHFGKIAKELGIPGLIYYSARKSFAQHAFTLGVDTSIIDYILGHSLGKTGSCLYSYIKVTPDMATAAVRKVLDALQ